MPQLTWLVTGCSSGFGEHFVHAILARGDRVIATARRANECLHHFEEAGAAILDLDVTASQADLDAKMKEALSIYEGIDVLVNNAGYIELGLMEDVSHERLLAQFNTNLFGAINLTRSILPHLRQKRSGTLVFIGSLAGWVGAEACGPYSATKFALEGFVSCLRPELAPFNISTLLVEPGNFRTDIMGPTRMKTNPTTIADYVDLADEISKGCEEESGSQPGDPRKGVERILDVVTGEGMAKGKTMPERLPLGRDALEGIREKCERTLKLCDEWERLICSTDY
ncbi:hypothetical protein MMC11_005381 [Xylographa trunciseda]|nr:hypothetical protein [Xylographa trunciseda]